MTTEIAFNLVPALTSLSILERLHVLQSLDASLNADSDQHSVPASSGGSITTEQQYTFRRRAGTPPEQYVTWEPARDAMLLRLINAT